MQVSVEATDGLERRMTVSVPAERVDKEVDNRLKSLSKTVKMAGFRPGKVPVKIVATRYGSQVRHEVISELTQTSFQDAVSQEKLRLAGMPKIEPINIQPGNDLEYIATFEVFGDIDLAPLDKVEISKPVTDISDQDVDHMIDKLRQQRITWHEVEREAQNGDRVLVDFSGTINGEEFKGNKGEQMPLVLGANSFIAGFEEGLIGSKVGDSRTLDLVFPDDYRVSEHAGKPVQFTVTVHMVEESALPEVDDEFMRSFEVEDGNIETFRNEIRNSMELELAETIKSLAKRAVMDALYEQNPIDTPSALVDSAIEDMLAQMQAQVGGQIPPNVDRAVFEPAAKRKAALSLIINDIARKQQLVATPDQIKEKIDQIAESYDQADEVKRWYYADRNRLANVEAMVIEDLVVAWVLDQVNINEKPMKFDEIMAMRKD